MLAGGLGCQRPWPNLPSEHAVVDKVQGAACPRLCVLAACLAWHSCPSPRPRQQPQLPADPLQGQEGRPGLPVSVLVGHEGPAAFLDFHPTHPDALLSASFDGTLRIWRARDASSPPIVLRVDPARFGLSGHAVTRCVATAWPWAWSGAAWLGSALKGVALANRRGCQGGA